MPIRFECECGKQLQAKDELAGRYTKCPACGTKLLIPETSDAVQEMEPEESPPPRESARRRPQEDPEEDFDESRPERPKRRMKEVKTSGAAVASFILALVGLCIPVLPALVSVVLAIVALVGISRGQGRVKGGVFATIGLVLSILQIVAVPVLIAVMLPAVQRVREAAITLQSANNLKQIGIAFHNYHDNNKRLPPAAIRDPNGKPLLSWRVALLPYIGEDGLYKQFHLNEAWDSPHNKALLPRMPKIYAAPGLESKDPSMTYYRVFVGPGSVFEDQQGLTLGKITTRDGTANTILVVEAADPVPWTKPDELQFTPTGPLPKLGFRTGDAQVLMCDASVHKIKKGFDEKILRALITWNGGESLPRDW